MSDFEKFKEELSNKEKFYSSLTDRKISCKEFEHVLNVWNKFEMKIMRDYLDLYLKYDVLLLADAFEKFRNKSLSGLILKTRNISKGFVLEVDLEYSKELRELRNDYSLSLDKIEIEREMLSKYQLNTAD